MLASSALRRTAALAAHLPASHRPPSLAFSPRSVAANSHTFTSSASSCSSSSASTAPNAPPKASSAAAERKSKDYYRHWLEIPTRWMDNDQYNHINNAVYYSLFDTLVNTFLATRCPTPPTRAFYVISSSASYHRPASFPAVLRGGMRVAKIGSSSVVYHVAVFDGEGECCVSGEFVHVCVEKDTGMGGATKSRPLPEATRKALEALV